MNSKSLYTLLLILLCACSLPSCQKGTDETQASKAILTNGLDSLSYAIGMGYSASKTDFGKVLNNFGSDSIYLEKLLEGLRDGIMSNGDKELLAYYIGLESGIRMRQQIVGLAEEEIFGDDTTRHLSLENVLAGFHDYMNGKTTFNLSGKSLQQKELRYFIDEKIKDEHLKIAAVKYADIKKQNEDFFNQKAQDGSMKQIDGILYKELKNGRGPHPTDGNMAVVEYEAHLIDGTLFDRTYAETNFPVEGEVEGLRIALKNMQPGDEWEICIPWHLGFGPKGRGTSMPPFATLIYKLKLIDFK